MTSSPVNPSPTPPQPPTGPALAAIRPAALQAMRAAMMKADGKATSEYQQPAHAFIAEVLPENPELHRQVALPGARRAIHLDALAVFHQRGLSDTEIVKEINAAVEAASANRREDFLNWRDGERADVLARARERQQRKQQMLLAKTAEIEHALDELIVVNP